MSWWTRLRNTIRGNRLIDDIDEELTSHLAEAVADGRDPREARRALGAALQHRERSRDVRRIIWLGDFLADLRYGARILRREPVFCATAVLSLGIGIGANTAVFSLIDPLLLRSLPVSRPDELVIVSDAATGDTFSYPEYRVMRDGTRTLSTVIAASSLQMLGVDAGGDVEQVPVKAVSGNYFAGLGIAADVGRALEPADEIAPVAVVSQRYWRRHFGASFAAIGRIIDVDGIACAVVGVAPAWFSGETPGESPDVWTSLVLEDSGMRTDRGFTWLHVIGRRRPAATLGQVHDDLASLLVAARPTAPPSETEARLTVAPGGRGVATLRGRLQDPLVVSMALSAIVLLIVCTNLAGLLIARGTSRRWELAMRLAIGASRGRVIRQLLTESLLMAVVGGVVGVLFATWIQAFLVNLPVAKESVAIAAGLNPRLLVFTGAVSVAATLIFGLVPAWHAARTASLHAASRIAGHRRRTRLRGVLIATQVALSMVLLAGSVMFARTIENLETQDFGFRAESLLLIPIVSDRGYQVQLDQLIPALFGRVRDVPGVSSVSAALGGTLGAVGGVRVQVEGSATHDRVQADWVGPAYFRTSGITVVAGRDFSLSDNDHAPNVVIANQTMARHYFGSGDALGRRVTFNKRLYEIVGVAADAKYGDLREATPAFLYFPTLQTNTGVNTLEVRMGSATPLALAPTVGAILHQVDPHLRPGVASTLTDRIDRKLGRERVVADLAGSLGGVVLALLSIGIYGTLAYVVGERSKEIAVRMALGARRSAIVWMMLRQMLSVLAWGMGIGGVAVIGVERLVRPLLFGIAPGDPWAIATAGVALVVVGLIAAWIPARAASHLDPAAVLQE